MMLRAARRAALRTAATTRRLSARDALPEPPTAALAKRSRLLHECTKYLDALEDLDLMTAKEMRVVYEKSEEEMVPLEDHISRLTKSRNMLDTRLREVEDEDLEGHCWPGAC